MGPARNALRGPRGKEWLRISPKEESERRSEQDTRSEKNYRFGGVGDGGADGADYHAGRPQRRGQEEEQAAVQSRAVPQPGRRRDVQRHRGQRPPGVGTDEYDDIFGGEGIDIYNGKKGGDYWTDESTTSTDYYLAGPSLQTETHADIDDLGGTTAQGPGKRRRERLRR